MIEGFGHWYAVPDAHPRARALFHRHYSAKRRGALDNRMGIGGAGPRVVYITPNGDALFVWRRLMPAEHPYFTLQGLFCTVFRNESQTLSSTLIQEADELAWRKWGSEPHFTMVNKTRIASVNPGYCFKQAGWELMRDETGGPLKTKGGLLLLQRKPLEIAV